MRMSEIIITLKKDSPIDFETVSLWELVPHLVAYKADSIVLIGHNGEKRILKDKFRRLNQQTKYGH